MDEDIEKLYTTGDVLRIFDIPYYKLQYWFETKRLPPARRTANGKRIYTEEDIKALQKLIPELVGDVSKSCNSSEDRREEIRYEDSV